MNIIFFFLFCPFVPVLVAIKNVSCEINDDEKIAWSDMADHRLVRYRLDVSDDKASLVSTEVLYGHYNDFPSVNPKASHVITQGDSTIRALERVGNQLPLPVVTLEGQVSHVLIFLRLVLLVVNTRLSRSSTNTPPTLLPSRKGCMVKDFTPWRATNEHVQQSMSRKLLLPALPP